MNVIVTPAPMVNAMMAWIRIGVTVNLDTRETNVKQVDMTDMIKYFF